MVLSYSINVCVSLDKLLCTLYVKNRHNELKLQKSMRELLLLPRVKIVKVRQIPTICDMVIYLARAQMCG